MRKVIVSIFFLHAAWVLPSLAHTISFSCKSSVGVEDCLKAGIEQIDLYCTVDRKNQKNKCSTETFSQNPHYRGPLAGIKECSIEVSDCKQGTIAGTGTTPNQYYCTSETNCTNCKVDPNFEYIQIPWKHDVIEGTTISCCREFQRSSPTNPSKRVRKRVEQTRKTGPKGASGV